MPRFVLVSIPVVFVVALSPRAAAQSPLVYNHYVPRPTVNMPARAVYADIPGSEHTLTLPTGTAVITWSTHGAVQCTFGPCMTTARFRPVIGNSSPPEGLPDGDGGASTGSWVTRTVAGSTTVKLQMAAPFSLDEYQWRFVMDSTDSFSRDTLSWTLMVFPDATAAGVPAIGGVGLAVLVIVLLGIGSVLASRRGNSTTT